MKVWIVTTPNDNRILGAFSSEENAKLVGKLRKYYNLTVVEIDQFLPQIKEKLEGKTTTTPVSE